jgi:hypothetical protein
MRLALLLNSQALSTPVDYLELAYRKVSIHSCYTQPQISPKDKTPALSKIKKYTNPIIQPLKFQKPN